MARQHSAPAERNKQAILAVLRPLLAPRGTALEVASGTGQHLAWFAAALAGWTWQPSDATRESFDSITAWCQEAALSNTLAPCQLDLLAAQWPSNGPAFTQAFDLIYCANMLHIAPYACCTGLMQGAARHLAPQGLLVTYGPYLEEGVPTAPSNQDFDASLRARNPNWGIRHLNEVSATARTVGLRLRERHAMPANNLLLVWDRMI